MFKAGVHGYKTVHDGDTYLTEVAESVFDAGPFIDSQNSYENAPGGKNSRYFFKIAADGSVLSSRRTDDYTEKNGAYNRELHEKL